MLSDSGSGGRILTVLRNSKLLRWTQTEDGEIYEGWIVVASAATVVMLVAGFFFYGLTTFFVEFREEFGWTAAATAIGFSLRSEVGGIAAPLVGWMLDRTAPRYVLRAGILVSAAGCVALSFIQNLLHFYLAMLLIAAGNSASGGQVGQYATATWFKAKRSLAMALMTFGGAVGGALVYFVALAVEALGWRPTLRGMAVILVVVAMTVGVRVRKRPDDHPQPLDGVALTPGQSGRPSDWEIPLRECVRSPSFVLLTLATTLTDFVRIAFVVHVAAFMENQLGTAKATAGLALLIFSLASAPGRVYVGWLGDKYPLRNVLASTMVPFAFGFVVLATATEPWHGFVAVLFVAPGFGGSVPLRPAIYAQYYGISTLGRVMGIGRLASTTGGALGAWFLGWLVDADGGSYDKAWLVAAAVTLLAIPASLVAKPPTDLQRIHERHD